MPTSPLPDRLRELLAKPNPCVMATLRPDGAPVSVPTWYLMEGDRFLVNLDEARKRLDHLRHDPRVSLTVLDADSWYTHVSMQGRVTELVEDPVDVGQIRVARHYTGKPYQVRDRKRWNAWIEIDRWHAWGAAKDAE